MSYHSHTLRDEVWTILAGRGYVIVDGIRQDVKEGDTVTMAAGCMHTIVAETDMSLLEVQLGVELSTEDKRYGDFEF